MTISRISHWIKIPPSPKIRLSESYQYCIYIYVINPPNIDRTNFVPPHHSGNVYRVTGNSLKQKHVPVCSYMCTRSARHFKQICRYYYHQIKTVIFLANLLNHVFISCKLFATCLRGRLTHNLMFINHQTSPWRRKEI